MVKKQKILIVEDETPIAKALDVKLSNSGFKTEVAMGGKKAIHAIHTKKYDLILLDLLMPTIDGFEVLKEMREDGDQTPVFVFSNLNSEEGIRAAMRLGAKRYFVKSDTTLQEAVRQIKDFFDVP